MITVGVVGDHPVERWGLERLFSRHPQIRIDASVASREHLAAHADLDVVIIDLYPRPHEPALAAITALSARHHVLVMSAYGGRSDVLAACMAGAEGYFTKDADEEEITSAVLAVATGGFYLSGSVGKALLADLDQRASRRPVLSLREKQALFYIAQGFTHAQTACQMGIRPATVNCYIERIRRKLGVGNKADLTRMAIELNVISGDRQPTHHSHPRFPLS